MHSTSSATTFDTDAVITVLSRPDDPDLQELLELVADICDSPMAGISVLKGSYLHIPAVTRNIRPFVSPAHETFCATAMDLDGIFAVEDASVDPRFADIGWANGRQSNARFYASAPIFAPHGEMVGRLCVVDSEPKVLTGLQLRSLEALALSVTKLIELRLLQSTRPSPAAPELGQAATTVVSQLAAELSHDLRVPLSSIVASVEMLQDELADHPDRAVGALLAQTTRAADRMVRMLEQNMELGDAGRTPSRVPVDLGLVLEQLVLDSAALLDPVGAVVEAQRLPVVRADPDDMYSVFQNLVTNAVKFARPDVPAWVRVDARPVEQGWRVTVRDNGVGIPPERRVDVFALFSRVASTVDGHGIGLATVARIVTAHGGRVGADEVAGGGTEMWFELPV